jgi:hypothetical protein
MLVPVLQLISPVCKTGTSLDSTPAQAGSLWTRGGLVLRVTGFMRLRALPRRPRAQPGAQNPLGGQFLLEPLGPGLHNAHHLDLAGQNGKPAGAESTPPAQQPAKITICAWGQRRPNIPVLAVRQSGLAGANLDLPAASGR